MLVALKAHAPFLFTYDALLTLVIVKSGKTVFWRLSSEMAGYSVTLVLMSYAQRSDVCVNLKTLKRVT